MGLMDGKTGLIVGIANERSYAYFIAESLLREGANCLFTHLPGEKMERRVRKACESLGVDDPWLKPLNAASDDELDTLFDAIKEEHGQLDFLVHSIAFADKDWLKEGV
ncbi:MAG: SDR family oxidoreductase, partial [Phycisphaerales bacterium]|nr:SDR family oxidoreductase [Phycisphaerales bacterium]